MPDYLHPDLNIAHRSRNPQSESKFVGVMKVFALVLMVVSYTVAAPQNPRTGEFKDLFTDNGLDET